MNMELEKKDFDFLLSELANALETHFDNSMGYLNITRMEIDYIFDVSFEQDFFPEDGDELLRIDPIPSHESFRIMEDFAGSVQDEKVQDRLFRMLGRSHPFSRFRDEVYDSGIEKEWFSYKDQKMKEYARNWLEENEVEYKDDRLVCHNGGSFIFNKEEFLEEYS